MGLRRRDAHGRRGRPARANPASAAPCATFHRAVDTREPRRRRPLRGGGVPPIRGGRRIGRLETAKADGAELARARVCVLVQGDDLDGISRVREEWASFITRRRGTSEGANEGVDPQELLAACTRARDDHDASMVGRLVVLGARELGIRRLRRDRSVPPSSSSMAESSVMELRGISNDASSLRPRLKTGARGEASGLTTSPRCVRLAHPLSRRSRWVITSRAISRRSISKSWRRRRRRARCCRTSFLRAKAPHAATQRESRHRRAISSTGSTSLRREGQGKPQRRRLARARAMRLTHPICTSSAPHRPPSALWRTVSPPLSVAAGAGQHRRRRRR